MTEPDDEAAMARARAAPDTSMHRDLNIATTRGVVMRGVSRFTASLTALASLAGFGAPAGAADGARMASDHGCLNCHYNDAQSAPTLKQLSDRVAREGDTPQALQHMLREMREHTDINSHQMVTDESALADLKWLAQGAK